MLLRAKQFNKQSALPFSVKFKGFSFKSKKRGNTYTLFQFVLTLLANRLVTPVGAMRSFKLNVWMMPLSKRSFSECWGVMCQLLGQQQEPGSGHFIYIPSHGGREC